MWGWTARAWYLWPLAAVVGVLAWRLIPVNLDPPDLGLFEQRTPLLTPEDRAAEYADEYDGDVVMVYTSGFWCGQLAAMLAGAILLLRDPAGPDLWQVIRQRVRDAALFALLLALVDVAVVLVTAPPALAERWSPDRLKAVGMTADQLAVPGWLVPALIVTGVAAFPLWAAIGVGLGAILGRWRRFAVLVIGYPLVLLISYQGYTRGLDGGTALTAIATFAVLVGLVLAVPLGGLGLLQILLHNPPWWSAMALMLTAALAAGTLLAGHRAMRGRIAATNVGGHSRDAAREPADTTTRIP